ncbi:Phenol 2-monooxygenase [Paramyrothecium foliicola]|nr:Phenol 2-monooxygenase [Paramyrothecium foliicola]
MSIQILSDLHLEQPKAYDVYEIVASAPYLALLGDIGLAEKHKTDLLDFLLQQLKQFKAVLFVPGNHEAYHSNWDDTIHILRDFEQRTRNDPAVGEFVLLDRATYPLPGTNTVILGCSLFSYILPDRHIDVGRSLNDFYQTTDWTTDNHNESHARDVGWLNDQVAELEQTDADIIIFSHWSPSEDSRAVDQRHKGKPINCAFATDMTQQLCFMSPRVKVWAFGHTHYNCDFEFDRGRLGAQYPQFLTDVGKFESFVHRFYDAEKPGLKKLLQINRATGIDSRASISDFETDFCCQPDPPSITDLDDFFRREGVKLASKACHKAIREWGGALQDITHTVAVTCTSNGLPGYDLLVAEELGLPSTMERILLQGVGCAGGLSIMRVAAQLACAATARGRPARILAFACELCTPNGRHDLAEAETCADPRKVGVAAALFSDAAASFVLCNDYGLRSSNGLASPILQLHEWESKTIGGTGQHMGFYPDAAGYRTILSKAIPGLIQPEVKPLFEKLLPAFQEDVGSPSLDVGSFDWALHPGGRAILSNLQDELGLTDEQLEATYQIYKTRLKGIVISSAIGTADTPRAHVVNPFAIECLRDIGLEDECKRLGVLGKPMQSFRWSRSMVGEEYGKIPAWGAVLGNPNDVASASPCPYMDLPQSLMEPSLIKYASHHNFEVIFNTRLVDVQRTDAGILCNISNTKNNMSYSILTRYLFGADGGKTTVGWAFPFKFKREASGGVACNVLINADLGHLMQEHDAGLHGIVRPDRKWRAGTASVLRMVRPYDQWSYSIVAPGLHESPFKDLTPQSPELIENVKEAIGDDSVDVEIVRVDTWVIRETVAESYSIDNDVFLLGDAAHRHPPAYGLGSNTCIQDAYNLGWKVAYVHKGLAGPGLLQTYNDERQPVGANLVKNANDGLREHIEVFESLGTGAETAEEGMKQLNELYDPTEIGAKRRRRLQLALEGKAREGRSVGIGMNQWYESSAVSVDDELTAKPELTGDPITTPLIATYPGFRLPHAWLDIATRRKKISTHDLAGHGSFCIFTGHGGEGWLLAAKKISEATGIPLKGALLLAGVLASPLELSQRGPVCNRDNLLRCVLDQRYTAQASAFCSGLEPFTSVLGTTTITETSTQWVDVTATTQTDVVTSVTTVYTHTIPSSTATVTDYYGEKIYTKRANGAAPAPLCMTNGVAYSASRITSACSCIEVPATTLNITLTAGTTTVTETLTSFHTASATLTSWETVATELVEGVKTITVPHPPLANLDFESGTLDGWREVKGSGGPSAFTVSVVSEPGPSGNGNKAVKIANNLNQGYTNFETYQLLRLEAGGRYRLSMAAKTTAANAGASIPKMGGFVWLRQQPLPIRLSFLDGGVAIGNGWYKFVFEFQMPQDKGGDSYVLFEFQRNATPVSTFLDDFSIERL